jgi:hypothetical protein
MAELRLSTAIYQLRLVLAGISPIVWRRLLVSSQTTIAQLHQYIQVAFDWSGEHLHRFRIHGKDYGIAYLGGMSFDDGSVAKLGGGVWYCGGACRSRPPIPSKAAIFPVR